MKTFEFVLQPSKTGNLVIEPQQFTYFDPEKKAYRTLMTQSLLLTVKPRVGQQAVPPTSSLLDVEQKEEPQEILESSEQVDDISFIEEAGSATDKTIIEIHWIILIVLCALTVVFVGRRLTSWQDVLPKTFLISRVHKKMLQKHQQDFELLCQKKEIDKLYTFFLSYLAYQAHVDVSIVTEQWMIEQLPSWGLTAEKIIEYIDFLNECASQHFDRSRLREYDVDQLLKKARYWMLIFTK